MNESESLRAQRDLIDEILALSEERDAAYEVRESDSARWQAAKQKYAEARRMWREVAVWKKAVDVASRSAQPETATVTGASVAPIVKEG